MSSNLHQPKMRDEREVLLSTAIGRRCRVHTLNLKAVTFGWIDQILIDKIRFMIAPDSELPEFDESSKLVLEIAGPSSLMIFMGSWLRSSGDLHYVQATSVIEERELDNASRIRVHGVSGTIKAQQQTYPVQLTDISDSGVGFSLESEIEIGTECEIELVGSAGPVNLLGSIRHMRGINNSSEFLGGAIVKTADRLAKARWTRLLSDIYG